MFHLKAGKKFFRGLQLSRSSVTTLWGSERVALPFHDTNSASQMKEALQLASDVRIVPGFRSPPKSTKEASHARSAGARATDSNNVVSLLEDFITTNSSNLS